MSNLNKVDEILKIDAVTTEPLKAIHSKCFNATINAFRSATLINFLNHFEIELSNYFDNCTITYQNDKNESKAMILKAGYGRLSMEQCNYVFLEILKQRQIELAYLFNKDNELSLSELTAVEHNFYHLLYNYGDKLGGYIGISSLNMQEMANIVKIFQQIEQKRSDYINNKK